MAFLKQCSNNLALHFAQFVRLTVDVFKKKKVMSVKQRPDIPQHLFPGMGQMPELLTSTIHFWDLLAYFSSTLAAW